MTDVPPGGVPPQGWNNPGQPNPGQPYPPQGQPPYPPQGGQPQPPYQAPGQPQQSYPPQDFHPQAGPPPKKKRRWLWFLLAIPLLFVVIIGGCVALFARSISGPIDATNAFVAHLDDGDYDAAFDSLCTTTKNSTDAGLWISGAQNDLGGDITSYDFKNVSIVNSAADVSGTIEIDEVPRTVSYQLVKEAGDWRVCSTN